MFKSSSIYNDLPGYLKTEIDNLYKTVHCRYDYLKGLEDKTDNQLREQLELDNQFMSQTHGAMHNGKRLKDILPDDVRKKLDSKCNDGMKTREADIDVLIEKRINLAKKILTYNKIGDVGDEIGDDQLGGSKRRTKSNNKKKSTKTKKSRSKKSRSKKSRRH